MGLFTREYKNLVNLPLVRKQENCDGNLISVIITDKNDLYHRM